jgi:hypothetical protein
MVDKTSNNVNPDISEVMAQIRALEEASTQEEAVQGAANPDIDPNVAAIMDQIKQEDYRDPEAERLLREYVSPPSSQAILDQILKDPRTYGAVAGGAGSLVSQYKESITPKKVTFDQKNIMADPITGKPVPIYDEAAGSRALTSNQGLNKGVSASESLAEQRFKEFLKNNPDYFKLTGNPMLTNPAGEMGPSVFNGTIFEPLSTTRQIANEAAQAPRAPAPPAPPSPLSIGDELSKLFPNAPKVAKTIKGALPVLTRTANAAGAGFNIADVINRVMDKDYTGAGISGVGGGLSMLASAPVGLPIGLATALVQYYRDNPDVLSKIMGDFEKMGSGNKPAPTASQFQANPMAGY